MTNEEKEYLFFRLNSTLVRFWKKNGRPPKELRIELLEWMLHWYKKIGYATMDDSSEIPNDLKEAAEKEYPCDKSRMTDSMLDLNEHNQVAFWKGAKWQKEKMMKGAVECKVLNYGLAQYPGIFTTLPDEEYNEGDKVRVIVLPKED